MIKFSKFAAVFAVSLSFGLSGVLGHEGHGNTAAGQGNTASHYLTEPVHLVPIIAAVALVATLAWLGYRWNAARNPSHKIAA